MTAIWVSCGIPRQCLVTLGDYLAGGGKVTDGMTIEGLGVVHPDFDKGNIIVDNLQPINKDTIDMLAGMGL